MSQVNSAKRGTAHHGVSWLITLSEEQIMDLMEARIIKLESVTEKILERLSAVERDVAVIRSNYVTKADLAAVQATLQASMQASIAALDSKMAALEAKMAALEARMLKWFIRTFLALAALNLTMAGLVFTAVRWMH